MGSVLRYLASLAVQSIAFPLPLGTLLVNVIGCAVLGFAAGLGESRWSASSASYSLLTIGLLGGFTTFSTFGHQTLELMRSGNAGSALLNVALNVILGLAAAALGWRLGKLL